MIFKDLGIIDYKRAWDYQEELLKENVAIKTRARMKDLSIEASGIATKHFFIFCEHTPVYTLGKSGSMQNVLLSERELKENGIEFSKQTGEVILHFMVYNK